MGIKDRYIPSGQTLGRTMKWIALPCVRDREQPALLRIIRSDLICAALTVAAVCSLPQFSLADEVPGFFGSLAAAPQQPGWSWASIYYHTSVSGAGVIALAKEFEIKNIPGSFSGQTNLNVKGTGDLGFVIPTYVFATPVLGGQASVSMAAAYGNPTAALNGTVMGTITGPGGGTIPFTKSGNINNSMFGFGSHPAIRAALEQRRQ